MMSRRANAITLVELMMVTIIIALCATMLFPLVRMMHEQALCARCESRMRQIPLAMQLYAAEHDGEFPATPAPGAALMPWLRTASMLRCPDDWLAAPLRPYRLHSGFFMDSPCNLAVVAESHRDRHAAYANYAFLDGHVKSLRPADAPALGEVLGAQPR